jgi:hypothetical protein
MKPGFRNVPKLYRFDLMFTRLKHYNKHLISYAERLPIRLPYFSIVYIYDSVHVRVYVCMCVCVCV